MRRACAWCGADLGYICDHCKKPTIPADIVRENSRERKTHTLGMICAEADPPFVFEITERTPTTHGICERCAALTDQERDRLVRDRRKRIPGISPATAAKIHDAQTDLTKKGVPR